MSGLYFGAVPVETVQQALGTPQRFSRHTNDQFKVCTLSGPFVPQLLPQDVAHQVFDPVPGINPRQDIEIYLLGFHFEDPRYKTDGASHGIVPVQDGQVHGLDLIG